MNEFTNGFIVGLCVMGMLWFFVSVHRFNKKYVYSGSEWDKVQKDLHKYDNEVQPVLYTARLLKVTGCMDNNCHESFNHEIPAGVMVYVFKEWTADYKINGIIHTSLLYRFCTTDFKHSGGTSSDGIELICKGKQ